MKIIINAKNIYGVMKYYPVCENAKLFTQIANTKTLTDETLRLINKLGVEIEVEQFKPDFNNTQYHLPTVMK